MKLLEVRDLHASYGRLQVLHGLDFDIDTGEIVVILGANGAGKTTTLRAVCNRVDVSGNVRLAGKPVTGRPTKELVRRGVALVPEGRGTFSELSVDENLLVGAYTRADRNDIRADVDRWYAAFPRLAARRAEAAGRLSGGEQQMLALARALMARPRLLLLDEPSLGLAPMVVRDLFARLSEINREEGTTMLLVEQNAKLALDIAGRAFVLEAGRFAMAGEASALRDDDAIRRAYLGY